MLVVMRRPDARASSIALASVGIPIRLNASSPVACEAWAALHAKHVSRCVRNACPVACETRVPLRAKRVSVTKRVACETRAVYEPRVTKRLRYEAHNMTPSKPYVTKPVTRRVMMQCGRVPRAGFRHGSGLHECCHAPGETAWMC